MSKLEDSFDVRNWDLYAQCYDQLMQLKPYSQMLKRVAVGLSSFNRVLDASCGTGNLELVVREMYPQNTPTIVGIDTSPQMLERATQKCKECPSFSFTSADLNRKLPFDSETFDCIVSLNTLYAVKKPEDTLQEFRRVLKPKGRIVLVTPKHGYENGLILREHCRSNKPESYWSNLHESRERAQALITEAINDPIMVKELCLVADYNATIAVNAVFFFFTEKEIQSLVKKVGLKITHFSYTYAEQDFFIILEKE